MLNENRAYISKILEFKEDICNNLEFIELKKHFSKDITAFLNCNSAFQFNIKCVTTKPFVIGCLFELVNDFITRIILGDRETTRSQWIIIYEPTTGMHKILEGQTQMGLPLYPFQ